MNGPSSRREFAARPTDADHWIKAAETPPPRTAETTDFTARLTVDITPELRGRI